MTTYILAGGCDRHYTSYGEQLARVIKNDIKHPKILSCMFSKLDTEAYAVRGKWKEWFTTYFGDDVNVVFADEDDFFEQVKEANVIYLHGGRTDLLVNKLSNFEKVKQAFRDKVVVGSSAGANYLSRVGFSPSKNEMRYGSGILDIAVIVHYGQPDIDGVLRTAQDWHKVEQSFYSRSGESRILRLPEGTFAVFSE